MTVSRQGAAGSDARGFRAHRGLERRDGVQAVFDHEALETVVAGDLGKGVVVGGDAHRPGVGDGAGRLAQRAQVGGEGRISDRGPGEPAIIAHQLDVGAVDHDGRTRRREEGHGARRTVRAGQLHRLGAVRTVGVDDIVGDLARVSAAATSRP